MLTIIPDELDVTGGDELKNLSWEKIILLLR